MSSFESWMDAFSRYDYIHILLISATVVFQVVNNIAKKNELDKINENTRTLKVVQ
jgi:hypothetical protein